MERLQIIFIFCVFLKGNFDVAHGSRGSYASPEARGQGTAPPRPIDIQSSAIPKPEDLCDPEIKKCDPEKKLFYSADGTCNNLKYPYAGQAELPYNRLLPAEYSDGKCALRKASDGSDLPLARLIRTTVLPENEIYTSNINMLCAGLGQFITHDVTFQKPLGLTDITVFCCKDKKPDPDMNVDKCLPVIIPEDDKFYKNFNVTCLEQTRSTNTEMKGCKMTPCAPINHATSYLDLSILYTAREDFMDDIRTHEGGLLKTKDNELEHSYPEITSGINCPLGGIKPELLGSCFNIGDTRVMQNPEITSISILFLRMHNDIAVRLQKINPHWSDEQLFHKARKIFIAMYQILVYKEHLPNIIGRTMCEFYKLTPAETDYVDGYDEELDSRTVVEYESVAGRVLHSIVRGLVPYQNATGQWDEYKLRDKFFHQEFLLDKNTFMNIVTAFASNQASDQDRYYSNEVANHQFVVLQGEYGTDLPATDILRARDHGAPTINKLREKCGLPKYKSFDDIKSHIRNPEVAEKLKWLYKNLDDVDSYVLGLLEKPMPGGLLGPTLACVTGESFQRWKFADRLYVEFKSAEFSPEQLNSIRQTTFAQILCTTNPGQEYVYQHSLLVPSKENPKIKCSEVQKIDLELWREQPPPADSSSCSC